VILGGKPIGLRAVTLRAAGASTTVLMREDSGRRRTPPRERSEPEHHR
jgi:hypothetical protein